MERDEIIAVLATYRRPGSPSYARHYDRLPAELLLPDNVPILLSILNDDSLPAEVRDHAAGALGRIGDPRAVEFLIDALRDRATQRGAATALGAMRAVDAREALAAVPRSVKAAAWALREIGSGGDADSVIRDLRAEQVRLIKGRVDRLSEDLRAEVAKRVEEEFRRVVAAGAPDYRRDLWMVAALPYLAPEGASEAIAGAFRLAFENPAAAPLRPHLARAAAAIGDPDLLDVLADVVCATEYPPHREVAAQAIRSIAGRPSGHRTLEELRDRLDIAAARLERDIVVTQPVPSKTPWDATPGTDWWFAASRRALKAIRAIR